MTKNPETDLDVLLINLPSSKSLCLTNNISNSSTPGFKAMKLRDHLHYTDFKKELLQQKISTLLQKKL